MKSALLNIPGRGLDLEYPMSLGVYDKYLEAQRVVDYLSDNDFPVQNIAIVGTELRSVERVTGRLTRGNVAAAGAMSGAVAGAVRRHCLLAVRQAGATGLPDHHTPAGCAVRLGVESDRVRRGDPPRNARLRLGQSGRGHEVRRADRAPLRQPGTRSARQHARCRLNPRCSGRQLLGCPVRLPH